MLSVVLNACGIQLGREHVPQDVGPIAFSGEIKNELRIRLIRFARDRQISVAETLAQANVTFTFRNMKDRTREVRYSSTGLAEEYEYQEKWDILIERSGHEKPLAHTISAHARYLASEIVLLATDNQRQIAKDQVVTELFERMLRLATT